MDFELLIIVAIFVIAWVSFVSRKKRVKTMQKSGVESIKQLKQLVGWLQAHRGLSAAKCNGDNSVDSNLNSLKRNIEKQIRAMPTSVTEHERWQSFIDHWQRVAKKNAFDSAENSFQQHTQIIGNVAYLLEDIAEQHLLNTNHLTQFKQVSMVWRELVNVTESVGQSRAVGTAAVTRKGCDSIELIRLKFLTKHITELTDTVLRKLSDLDTKNRTLIKECLVKTTSLTTVINEELIGQERITISRVEYFDLATDTMELLNQLFDCQLLLVEELLN